MLAALILPTLLTAGSSAPANAIQLNEPKVQYRADEASATRSPWIDANGWRILRMPGQKFVYRVKGETAALAAAESFTYGAASYISTDARGAAAFNKMLALLKTVPAMDASPIADFGVVDDGSNLTGELLNLLTRMNLLYKSEKAPVSNFKINVRIANNENPSEVAHRVRSQIGDDRRSLRIYGSETVIARLLQGRVFLLNYSGKPILGLRVRIAGKYSHGEMHASGMSDSHPSDWTLDGLATEFSVPELHTFAVIDLSR